MAESVAAAEAIISDRAFFFIDDCANFAEATLIFYEYCITLDSEIRLIWRRKLSGASVLFFLNRYLMVLDNAITVGSYWPMGNSLWSCAMDLKACVVLGWFAIVLNLLPYFIWNAFSTLRTYALCGRDWRVAALVCLLMCGPIVANAYNIPLQKPDNLPQPYNCQVDNGVTVALHTQLVLGSRISLIIGDAVVLGVTWWKTYRLKRAADAARVKTSIVDLLLRDGTVYFATMLVLNVLHILINFVEQVSFMGDIADVLTSILVSRFLMNLRALDAHNTGQASLSRTDGALETWRAADADGRGSLVFASQTRSRSGFMESMGGPLEPSLSVAPLEAGSELETEWEREQEGKYEGVPALGFEGPRGEEGSAVGDSGKV